MLPLIVISSLASLPAAPSGWSVVYGNACGDEPCGCTGDDCHDKPGVLHFAGTLPTAEACEATCTGAPSDGCSVWLWSATSQHCWWRTDNVFTEMKAGTGVISGCRSVASGSAKCVPGCGGCGVPPTPPPPPPAPFKPSDAPNMNGEYILSNTPKSKGFTLNKFSDYPGGVEYFDLYSPPISSVYAQVFWTGLPPVDLPADVVQRYAGRGMAIVGFETDQVRQTPDGDVPVPINCAYNHHFEAGMSGAKSRFEKIEFDGADDPRRLEIMAKKGGHAIPKDTYYVIHDMMNGTNPIPTSASIGNGNGGEYRGSFHGYAPGYAQIIDSPTTFQFTPMQIDTWNRDHMKCNESGPVKFVPGPEPANAWAPRSGNDAIYSGLLECPVSTRITKLIDANYAASTSGTCTADGMIDTASECFRAAALALGAHGLTGVKFMNTSGTNASQPSGCSVSVSSTDQSTYNTYFNFAQKAASCSEGATVVGGESISVTTLAVKLDAARAEATIKMSGPADVWFGVGFNASAMKDAPWAIIVDGEGVVQEYKLSDQGTNNQKVAKSVSIVSNSVANGVRTVVVSRPLKGASADHFTFSVDQAVLPFINAIGTGPQLAFHKNKQPASLAMVPFHGAGACICALAPKPFGQGKGSLLYTPVKGQAADTAKEGALGCCNSCMPFPRSDLLDMKNPTCDIRTYVGGQIACHHLWNLLDAEQEIPWPDQPQVYRQKFRFWVQPYNASYHRGLKHTTWGIGSPVEYDVPKCAEGIQGCKQTPDGNWVHTITGTWSATGKVVAAHFHCHAPTCLSMVMYRCPKGTKICNETTGEEMCGERPVYGGTGKIANKNLDEPGFILQPPCLWAVNDGEYGLEASFDVKDYVLGTVKTSNATYGHHGEMAWQQMYLEQ